MSAPLHHRVDRRRRARRPIGCATFVAALGIWTNLLAPTTAREAPPAAQRAERTPATTPRAGAPATLATEPALAHWSRAPESDVVAEPYALTIDDLRALAPGDRLSWPDPEGGAIDLAVVARERVGDLERISLVHDGLPSTVTLGARTFYATIATARGAYAVGNDSGETMLVRHTVLDGRMPADVHDYAPTPRA